MALQQTIPLSVGFTDQYINVPGNWLALDSSSTGSITAKFDDTSYGEVKLDPGSVYSLPFQRFWLSSPDQDGRIANITIGFANEKPPLSAGSVQSGVLPQIGSSYFRSEGLVAAGSSNFPIFTAVQNISGCILHSICLVVFNSAGTSNWRFYDDSAFNGLFGLYASVALSGVSLHITNEALPANKPFSLAVSVTAGGAASYTATVRYSFL